MKSPPRALLPRLFQKALLVFAAVALGLHAAPAAAAPIQVRDVALTAPAPGAAELFVSTSAPPHFAARVTDGGMRLVVDLDESVVSGAPSAITKGNLVVGGVMTQGFQQNGQP